MSLDRPRGGTLAAFLLLLAAVAFGTAVRVRTALADPNFDARSAEGMLKSDPALLYYFTERIAESGGLPPEDFRADPRVEHPDRTDVPATFTVGQEFLVAWAWLLTGRPIPLHDFCLWAMGLFASLVVLAAYGLAREVTGSRGWACFAAALTSLLPANYRTIGFILVREDFAFPWLAAHLWLLARAARVRTARSLLLAGAALGLALSSWHATGFFVAIEAACLLAWYLRTSENALAARAGWLVPVAAAAFCVAVPALRAKVAILSLPMLIAWTMLLLALLERRAGPLGRRRIPAALGLFGVLLVLSIGVSRAGRGGFGDYSHVFEVLWHKAKHFGRLPEDPREISFDARLLWQGPFNTLDPAWGFRQLLTALLLFVPAAVAPVRSWLRGRGPAIEPLLVGFCLLSLPVSYAIERTIILPGFLLPVAAAGFLARLPSLRVRLPLAIAALALQAVSFEDFVRRHRISWYEPPQRQAEIASLVRAVRRLVPEGEAVAGDFMNSTAILAHTGRGIVLQPKYETRRSRRRAEAFLTTFFEGSPEDLRRLLLERFRCRFLLVDRWTLWTLSRYAAGIPWSQDAPAPGTAAAVFLSRDEALLRSVPGFRLLYRSPTFYPSNDDRLVDWMRLYALDG